MQFFHTGWPITILSIRDTEPIENRANYAVVWASTVIDQLPENVSIAPLPAINAAPFTLANGWMWVLTNPSEEKRQLIVALAGVLVNLQIPGGMDGSSRPVTDKSINFETMAKSGRRHHIERCCLFSQGHSIQ